MSRPSVPAHARVARAGFTLVEILVVVGIVAILVAITTMVGTAVINTGKRHATMGILQTLDESLAAYIDKHGDIPPALVEIPYAALPANLPGTTAGESAFYPAIDGRGTENLAEELKPINSVALFIESVKTVPETQDIINQINPRYLQNYSPDEDPENDPHQPFLLTVFDAWGNPIRYVHPKFDGIFERVPRRLGEAGEPFNIANPNKPYFVAGALPVNAAQRVRMKFVRRNFLIDDDYGGEGPTQGGVNPQAISEYDLLPDSDGGLTSGNRPYFYSAGPDGNPSTLEDNIYLSPPQHQDPGVN